MKTMSMINYKQGDIVLVPFPFTDLTATKQRPALIISSDWYNSNRQDVILVAITSQIPSILDLDEYLLTKIELNLSGLPKPSIIKFGKIFTIDIRLIRKSMGHLPTKTIINLKSKLIKIF